MKSTNPVVANALNSVKAKNAKFKVGDIVIEPSGGSKPTKIIRVFNLPQDEKKLASEFGNEWKEVRADYMRGKTWYNIERDGKGAFYTDLDLKKVTNSSCRKVATNAGVQFTQHDIYANLNTAQNRIVNAINLGFHLEEPFKSKLAPGIAKLRQINTDLGRAISDLAMEYKSADKESEG